MYIKDLGIEVKSVNLEERTVEGYAATWDLDQVRDIIHRGAFQKSLQERFPANKIKLLRDHSELIGRPVEMREDETGLYVKAYISKTPLGDETLQLARDGILDRFSIGFSIPEGKSQVTDDGVRHIYEAKLYEFSLVTFPANEAAVLTLVKGLRDALNRGTITADDLALALNAKTNEPQGDTDKPLSGEQDPADAPLEELEELKHLSEQLANFARNRLY